MAEFQLPRQPEVTKRLYDFYETVGWDIKEGSSEFFHFVNPQILKGIPPVATYWQTETKRRIASFSLNESDEPTRFARGLRLPSLRDEVEVALIVPTDEDVHAIFERGGPVMASHAHVPPRATHEGRQEIRFSDPFFYGLTVTSTPDWEMPALREA